MSTESLTMGTKRKFIRRPKLCLFPPFTSSTLYFTLFLFFYLILVRPISFFLFYLLLILSSSAFFAQRSAIQLFHQHFSCRDAASGTAALS